MKNYRRLSDSRYIGVAYTETPTHVDIDSSDDDIEQYIEERRLEFYREWFDYLSED